MTSKHKHTHCEHEHLEFCKHCRLVHCLDCSQEWRDVPWNTYTVGQAYPYPYTQGGGIGSGTLGPAFLGTTTNCSHKD